MRKKSKEFIRNAVELGLTVGDISDAIRIFSDTELPKEEIRRRVKINLQRILNEEYKKNGHSSNTL